MTDALSQRRRRVWLWADSHNGQVVDGKDGGRWAELSAREMFENVGRPDYALVLGDVTHAAQENEFRRYARLRDRSGVPLWYEIVGNHDYRGIARGFYAKYVRRERRYVLLDGNLVWVMISAERSRAMGILRPRTRAWLEDVLATYQDRNVIVCSHQVVANTVFRSDPSKNPHTILKPVKWVSALRRRRRIDAWLFAHEHGPRRTSAHIRRIGRTTFINVASFSHSYGTEACNSFWFEMRAGGKEIRARCRDHDERRFVPELGTVIPLPYPIELDARPQMRHVRGWIPKPTET